MHETTADAPNILRNSGVRLGWGGAFFVAFLALLTLLVLASSARAQDSADPGSTPSTTTTTQPTTTTTTAAYGTLDLTLHKGGGRSENTKPAGIWSDGEKLWVGDENALHGVFIYDLETGAFESRHDPWFSSGQYWYAGGIWSNSDRLWVATGRVTIYSYDYPELTNGGHFMNYSNSSAWGLWSDGSRLWMSVKDGNVDTGIYSIELDYVASNNNRWAYRQEIDLSNTANTAPTGIWSNGTTLWVADDADDKIYAYDLKSKLRMPGLDIDLLKEAGNTSPRGLWSNDGETLWVVDSDDAVIYTYPLPTDLRLASLSFTDIVPEHSFDSGRLEYGKIVVPSGVSSTTVTAAAVSDDASVVITPADADPLTEGHQVALATGENEIAVTVTDGVNSLVYTLLVKRSTHATVSNDVTLASLSVDDVDIGTFDAATDYYFAGVPNSVSQVTMHYAATDPTVSLSLTPADADSTKDGHQIALTPGRETAVEFTLVSSDETQIGHYTLALGRDATGRGSRLFTREFRFLDSRNASPRGLWSDGDTMWVLDVNSTRAFAYNLDTREPDADKDVDGWTNPFDTPGYHGHFATDFWSDGETLWLVDMLRPQIAAFDMETSSGIHKTPNLESYDLPWVSGLWSDGSTMWVLHRNLGPVRDADGRIKDIVSSPLGLYGFDLETLARVPDEDVLLQGVPADKELGAIWSDGETLWAIDRPDKKLLAFELATGARAEDYDVSLVAANGSAGGLWSDGEVLWVSDWMDERVYAYRFADNTFLASLDVSGVDLSAFSKGRLRYEGVVASGVSEVTVSAGAASAEASVMISPADADSSTEGHQVSLESGENVISVTVSDGLDTRVYTVVVDQSPHAVLSSDASLSSLSVSGTSLGIFDAAVFTYQGFVTASVTPATVTFTPGDETASVSVTPADADESTAGHQVAVPAGEVTTVRVAVVSSDRSARSTYVVRLSRDAPAPGGRRVLFDVDTLDGAANNNPQGIWSNGSTVWVADVDEEMLFAYDLTSKQRLEDRELVPLHFEEAFDESGMVGNSEPLGIWSDGSTMWVGDGDDRYVYAYDLATGTYIESKDVDMSALANLRLQGLWSDGTTLWAADDGGDTVYAYNLLTRTRQADSDVTLHAANSAARGIWSDGGVLWVVDSDDDKVYAYSLTTSVRIPGLEFNLAAANGDARGIWSDGSTLWIADGGDDKLFAYRMPANTLLSTLSLSDVDLEPAFAATTYTYTTVVPSTVAAITVSAAANSTATVTITPADSDTTAAGHQVALATGENTVTVSVATDASTQIYTVTITRSTHQRLSGDAALKMLDLEATKSPRAFEPGVVEYKGVVDHDVNQPTLELRAADDTATLRVSPADADDQTDGHQVPVAAAGTTTITVDVDSSDGRNTKQYTLIVTKDAERPGGRRALFDIDDLATEAGDARGLTSDGTTLWVVDAGRNKLVAYTLATGERHPAGDISLQQTTAPIRLFVPEGAWTDGTTVYVANSADLHIYAYNLTTGTRDTAKDLDVSELTDARITGIWSDGTTMWIADTGFDHSLYAFDLATGARDTAADITNMRSFFPRGLWSDGATMWIADTYDDTAFAYDLATKRRISGKDVRLGTAGNSKPHGIWSDGTTLYAIDTEDNKVYAYRMHPNQYRPTSPPETTPSAGENAPDEENTATTVDPQAENTAENTAPETPPDDGESENKPDDTSPPEDTTPEDNTPENPTPPGNTPEESTPNDGTPEDPTPPEGSTPDDGTAEDPTPPEGSTPDDGTPENPTPPEDAPPVEPPALVGTFHDMPTTHDGSEFTFEFRISEAVGLGFSTVRDEVLTATGATITRARRIEAGSNQRWRISAVPSGDGDITVAVRPTQSCDDDAAVCTSDGRKLAPPPTATIAGPDSGGESDPADNADPLRASWTPPASHSGAAFTFELTFNKPIRLSYKHLRDTIIGATGATVTRANRIDRPSNQRWNISIVPDGTATIELTLTTSGACGTETAICTHSGEQLTTPLTATIPGP